MKLTPVTIDPEQLRALAKWIGLKRSAPWRSDVLILLARLRQVGR